MFFFIAWYSYDISPALMKNDHLYFLKAFKSSSIYVCMWVLHVAIFGVYSISVSSCVNN